jgi:hypothetical protein
MLPTDDRGLWPWRRGGKLLRRGYQGGCKLQLIFAGATPEANEGADEALAPILFDRFVNGTAVEIRAEICGMRISGVAGAVDIAKRAVIFEP